MLNAIEANNEYVKAILPVIEKKIVDAMTTDEDVRNYIIISDPGERVKNILTNELGYKVENRPGTNNIEVSWANVIAKTNNDDYNSLKSPTLLYDIIPYTASSLVYSVCTGLKKDTKVLTIHPKDVMLRINGVILTYDVTGMKDINVEEIQKNMSAGILNYKLPIDISPSYCIRCEVSI